MQLVDVDDPFFVRKPAWPATLAAGSGFTSILGVAFLLSEIMDDKRRCQRATPIGGGPPAQVLGPRRAFACHGRPCGNSRSKLSPRLEALGVAVHAAPLPVVVARALDEAALAEGVQLEVIVHLVPGSPSCRTSIS